MTVYLFPPNRSQSGGYELRGSRHGFVLASSGDRQDLIDWAERRGYRVVEL